MLLVTSLHVCLWGYEYVYQGGGGHNGYECVCVHIKKKAEELQLGRGASCINYG